MIKMELTFGSFAEAAIAMSALASMGMPVKGAAGRRPGPTPAEQADGHQAGRRQDPGHSPRPPRWKPPPRPRSTAAKATEPEAQAQVTYLDVEEALGGRPGQDPGRPGQGGGRSCAECGAKVGHRPDPERMAPGDRGPGEKAERGRTRTPLAVQRAPLDGVPCERAARVRVPGVHQAATPRRATRPTQGGRSCAADARQAGSLVGACSTTPSSASWWRADSARTPWSRLAEDIAADRAGLH